jgi:uncharacterized membrane protein
MEITSRALWTIVHGMGFGALYLLACSGALLELHRMRRPAAEIDARLVRGYFAVMTVLAWFAVLSGTYIVYPWYRAAAPVGANLAGYPQALLRSSAATVGWHTLGMEWKEHVAWIVPIAITMATAVFWRYGARLREFPQLRRVVLGFTLASFLAAGVAGFFGAMINKVAPTQGGSTIQLSSGDKK